VSCAEREDHAYVGRPAACCTAKARSGRVMVRYISGAGNAVVGGSVGGILGVDRRGYWPAVGHVSTFKDLLGVPLLGEVEA